MIHHGSGRGDNKERTIQDHQLPLALVKATDKSQVN
jgi:hypothetical protein